MADAHRLMIFGASTRAAAFSAARAGLEPWCADLFADRDHQAVCSVARVPLKGYPTTFGAMVQSDMPGSWMYTGALENEAVLVGRMAGLRPLWGNFGLALHHVRSPSFLAEAYRKAGVPHPAVRDREPKADDSRRWLAKPVAGAGGRGIRMWSPTARARQSREVYYQEHIEGEPWSAAFVGRRFQARLLGVTKQLVGEPWLHAAPFHYCGSLGPIYPPAEVVQSVEKVGRAIAAACGLRGLFGVDGVIRDGVFWPVEVNPRFTASMEVLDYGTGVSVLSHHRQVFEPAATLPPPRTTTSPCLGKAILFAREAVTFPDDGPWMRTLQQPPALWDAPDFADVPAAGEPIAAGRPVLTFFARGQSAEECRDRLQSVAVDLDRRLFGR